MAIAVLWRAVFRDDGLINTVIKMVTFGHFEGPSWLSDPGYALWVICILRIWQFGSAMVLFLAALKGVPGRPVRGRPPIDGAGKWRQFFSITVPMITPIIFYNLVTQICQAFQEFNGPYIITNGGPRNATTLISHAGLPVRLPAERDGWHGFGPGLDHVRHRLRADGHRIHQPEEVGLLLG